MTWLEFCIHAALMFGMGFFGTILFAARLAEIGVPQ